MASPRRVPSSAAFATLCLVFVLQLASVSAQVFSCTGGTVYAVAHPDDDLLFQSPDLYNDMVAQNCITTIFLTSGDSGIGSTYAQARESGNEAATSNMANVDDTYTEIYATFGGQAVLVRTLVGMPSVQKVYFRLPDGDVDGTGYPSTNYQTLRELYFGSIGSITSQPGDATYTMATLKLAISQILTARQPVRVRTLDYLSQYDSGDHSDHYTVARILQSLVGTFAPLASFQGYMGYPVQNLAPTLSTSDPGFIGKSNAFFQYTPYDSGECQSFSVCQSNGRGEAYWLLRQYVVTSALATSNTDGAAIYPTDLPSIPNVAPLAIASASTFGSGQPPFSFIDGVISGYPGNSSAEWSSAGQGAGATATLTWSTTYNISAIALYDRPNINDWILAGTFTFSDGSSSPFGVLNNDGSATLFTLDNPVITSSITMTVTAVSGNTGNAGLSEFQAYGSSCPGCTNNITSTTTTSVDLALSGTATASSYSGVQSPDKAIDNIAMGYPQDYTKEWSSNGETVGAWILISWNNMFSVDSVTLYDRPNLNDWIQGGYLTFSDGSTFTVGSLNNDGSATPFSFPVVNTTSIMFTVTAAGPNSGSVGLAEFRAFYSGVQPTAFASPTTTSSAAIGTPTLYPTTYDLALNATATASSSSAIQPPSSAIDGWVGGYTPEGNVVTEEWASNGQGAGAWILLTWPQAIQVNLVVLYDRPNTADQVTGGYLTFADGTKVVVGALDNRGSATPIILPSTITTTTIMFTVTSVSATTSNVGLSEFEVFGPSSGLVSSSAVPTSSGASSVQSSASASQTSGSPSASFNMSSTVVSSTAFSANASGATSTGSASSTISSALNVTSIASGISGLPTGVSSVLNSSGLASSGAASSSVPSSANASSPAVPTFSSSNSSAISSTGAVSSSISSSVVVSSTGVSSGANVGVSSAPASSSVISSAISSSANSSSANPSSAVASSSAPSSATVSGSSGAVPSSVVYSSGVVSGGVSSGGVSSGVISSAVPSSVPSSVSSNPPSAAASSNVPSSSVVVSSGISSSASSVAVSSAALPSSVSASGSVSSSMISSSIGGSSAVSSAVSNGVSSASPSGVSSAISSGVSSIASSVVSSIVPSSVVSVSSSLASSSIVSVSQTASTTSTTSSAPLSSILASTSRSSSSTKTSTLPSSTMVSSSAVSSSAAAPTGSSCSNSAYDQCGGLLYYGSSCCPSGSTCIVQSPLYSYCSAVKQSATTSSSAAATSTASSCSNVANGQCDGLLFSGSSCCPSGYSCTYQSVFGSYCLANPATKSSSSSSTTSSSSIKSTSSSSSVSTTSSKSTAAPVTTSPSTTVKTTTTTTAKSTAAAATSSLSSAGKLINSARWTYKACQSDGVNNAYLMPNVLASAGTIESCLAACDAAGYALCGMEYGSQCFGGNAISSLSTVLPASSCNMACPANSAETCGGNSALDLYKSNVNALQTWPSTPNLASFGSWAYYNCYADLVNNVRSLPIVLTSASNSTIEGCLAACSKINALACAMSYYGECYGATQASGGNTAASALPASRCTFPCKNNPNENCGGNAALSVYFPTKKRLRRSAQQLFEDPSNRPRQSAGDSWWERGTAAAA